MPIASDPTSSRQPFAALPSQQGLLHTALRATGLVRPVWLTGPVLTCCSLVRSPYLLTGGLGAAPRGVVGHRLFSSVESLSTGGSGH